MTTWDERERGIEATEASQQSAALRHLLHDVGTDAQGVFFLNRLLQANYGAVIDGVLAQRKKLSKDNQLEWDGTLPKAPDNFLLDLKALGFSDGEVLLIKRAQAERTASEIAKQQAEQGDTFAAAALASKGDGFGRARGGAPRRDINTGSES